MREALNAMLTPLLGAHDWWSTLWWVYNSSALKVITGLGLLGVWSSVLPVLLTWPAARAAKVGQDPVAFNNYNRYKRRCTLLGRLALVCSVLPIICYAFVLDVTDGDTSKTNLPGDCWTHAFLVGLYGTTALVVVLYSSFYYWWKTAEAAEKALPV